MSKQKLGILIFGLATSILLTSPAAHAITKFEQASQDGERAYKNKQFPEAEKAFEEAVKEATEKFDKDDKRTSTAVYNLALVYQAEQKYPQAEETMKKALDLMILIYGPDHQTVAQLYMDLGDMFVEQAGQAGNTEHKKKAAEYYKKGIEIFENIYGKASDASDNAAGAGTNGKPKGDDESKSNTNKKGEAKLKPEAAALDLANAVRLLANMYAEDELYDLANPLYKRCIELEEYGKPDSKELCKLKADVARVYCEQQKYKEADPLFEDALTISEKTFGPDSKETGDILYNFGGMHYDQGEFARADARFSRAISILAKTPGEDPMDIAQKKLTLAYVMDMEGKGAQSEEIYKGLEPAFVNCQDKQLYVDYLKKYQTHLLMQDKKAEAAKVATKIKGIRADLKKAQQEQ